MNLERRFISSTSSAEGQLGSNRSKNSPTQVVEAVVSHVPEGYPETFAINLFSPNTALKTCSNRHLHSVNSSFVRDFALSSRKIDSLQRSHPVEGSAGGIMALLLGINQQNTKS